MQAIFAQVGDQLRYKSIIIHEIYFFWKQYADYSFLKIKKDFH